MSASYQNVPNTFCKCTYIKQQCARFLRLKMTGHQSKNTILYNTLIWWEASEH